LFLFFQKWKLKTWSHLLDGIVAPIIAVAHIPLLDQYSGSSSFFYCSGQQLYGIPSFLLV
jgi:hypothetical protein